jgi:hypothetical protein
MFYVGQKVVCVNAKPRSPNWPGTKRVVEGAVYTIRAVYFEKRQNATGVLLSEIVNEFAPSIGCEPGFLASRFRPVVERKTDISIFTDMLTPKTEQVSA